MPIGTGRSWPLCDKTTVTRITPGFPRKGRSSRNAGFRAACEAGAGVVVNAPRPAKAERTCVTGHGYDDCREFQLVVAVTPVRSRRPGSGALIDERVERVPEQRKPRRALKWSAAVVGALFVYWNTWWSGAASGRIVDDATSKPLQNVVVVTTWTLERSITGAPVGYADVQEARTDSNGVFKLRAWGPRFRLRGSISPIEPESRAFHPGYQPIEIYGVGILLGKAPILRMRSLSGEEYRKSFDDFLGELSANFFNEPSECEWQSIPQLLAALKAEARTLGDGSLTLFNLLERMERWDCHR